MRQHEMTKIERANVIAGFDSQDDAEEALLGLRLTGFRDSRIGYYYPKGDGRMADLLVGHHRFIGAIIGTIVGAALGPWIGQLLTHLGYPFEQTIDPVGLAITCGVCGALFLGMAGGMIGLWADRSGADVPAPAGPSEPYLLAIDAGGAQDQARAIIHRHGGHERLMQGSARSVR